MVNEPALIGVIYPTVIKEGNTYYMWANPSADNNYTGSRSLRYRTSGNGGSGWGHWETGGTLVQADGGEVGSPTRLRKQVGGTYELFYREGDYLNKATGDDRINFTTQISEMVDFAEVLPGITNGRLHDFEVVNVNGEDWVYFSYCDDFRPTQGCFSSGIAVTKPVSATNPVPVAYLPLAFKGFNCLSNPLVIRCSPVVYLPLVFKNFHSTPDLIPKALVAGGNSVTSSITVTVKNIGGGPVTNAFWVDVYINPHTIPTKVGDQWPDFADEGLAWKVTQSIPANGELILTIGDAYYSESASEFTRVPNRGDAIYVQVDSTLINSYGGVLETHEIFGGSYNNITDTTWANSANFLDSSP